MKKTTLPYAIALTLSVASISTPLFASAYDATGHHYDSGRGPAVEAPAQGDDTVAMGISFSATRKESRESYQSRMDVYEARSKVVATMNAMYERGNLFFNDSNDLKQIVTTTASNNPHMTLYTFKGIEGGGIADAPKERMKRVLSGYSVIADPNITISPSGYQLFVSFTDGTNLHYGDGALDIDNLSNLTDKAIKAAHFVYAFQDESSMDLLGSGVSIETWNLLYNLVESPGWNEREQSVHALFKIKEDTIPCNHVSIMTFAAKAYDGTSKGEKLSILPGEGFRCLVDLYHEISKEPLPTLVFCDLYLNHIKFKEGNKEIKAQEACYTSPEERRYGSGPFLRQSLYTGRSQR